MRDRRSGRPIGRLGALLRLPFFVLPSIAVAVFLVPAIPQFEAPLSDPRLPRLAAYAIATLPVIVAVSMALISLVAISQLIATVVSPTVRVKPGAQPGAVTAGWARWSLPLVAVATALYVFAVVRPAHVSSPQPPVSVQRVTPIHVPLQFWGHLR
jgi:hypothetical protein